MVVRVWRRKGVVDNYRAIFIVMEQLCMVLDWCIYDFMNVSQPPEKYIKNSEFCFMQIFKNQPGKKEIPRWNAKNEKLI